MHVQFNSIRPLLIYWVVYNVTRQLWNVAETFSFNKIRLTQLKLRFSFAEGVDIDVVLAPAQPLEAHLPSLQYTFKSLFCGYCCCTVFPRSSDHFYIVTYNIKWVTTSWIDGICCCCYLPCNYCSIWTWVVEEILAFF